MTEIQPQHPLEYASTHDEKSVLIDRLDELLAQYLATLDQYQKAQQLLSSHLSSGYMSLAQANFNNNSHARYGRDYYDERMQAGRRITITDTNSAIKFTPSSPTTSLSQDKPTSKKEDSANTDEEEPTAAKQPPTDPLRWFGILIPPPLRSAQTSFITAVEGPIPSLAFLGKELRRLEMEIGRVRKGVRRL